MAIKIDVPTQKSPGGWLICSTPLGCGSRILQGWSSGIGIGSNSDFEKKFAKLLAWSSASGYGDKIDKTSLWTRETISPTIGCPIGIGHYKLQFLKKGQTYTLSSLVEWIERFESFVNKYQLGDFSKSHVWVNHNYTAGKNITALWTWNGNVPNLKEVGLEDWENNPENIK